MTLNPITISIHSLGENGEGLGSYQGHTIYVDGALIGEEVEVRIIKSHKTYSHATVVKVLKPSLNRVQPVCKHFDICGGCQLMHLEYAQQLLFKQQKVIKALQRYENTKDIRVEPCLPSPSTLHYRNKIQLPVQKGLHGLKLGLYARGSHDLVEIDTCAVHCNAGEEIYTKVKEIIKKSNLSAYDPQTKTGELRHVLIKSSENLKEVLVILVTASENRESLLPIAEEIMKTSPLVKGVVHNVNQTEGNVILGQTYHLLAGTPHIHHRLKHLLFTLSPASFFQVNAAQAECLYEKALEFAEVTGSETVLDAYCGVGTISLFFANHVQKVIGIESVPQAIENARENAKLNNISNVEFVCAQAEEYIYKLEQADIVLLNPPRKGCEQRFLKGVVSLKPSKVVYISCNPATLARDLNLLCTSGYQIIAVQPYDMFPQTAHVECVVQIKIPLTK